LFSSGIGGGRDSADPAQQAKQMFGNVRQVMEKAGGSPDNIVHMTLRLKDRSLREYIDPEWPAMFPDEKSRPARHAAADPSLSGNALM
jgi:2-iminobutanoate/2-iminopropanoate deaminase